MTVNSAVDAIVSAARDYMRRGFAVLLLWGVNSDGLCECGSTTCSNIGKHPNGFVHPRGAHDATRDEATFATWLKRVDNPPNLGIALDNHVLVVDVDPRNDGSLEQVEALAGPLDAHYRVRTGGGGHHVYFDVSDEQGPFRGKLRKGIDVKKVGGIVVAPPSLHASGRRYEFEGGELLPLPDGLRQALRRDKPRARVEVVDDEESTSIARRRVTAWGQRIAAAEPGTRNDTLNRLAFVTGGAVANGDIEPGTAMSVLRDGGLASGLDPVEVERTLQSAITAGQQHPLVLGHDTFATTDIGNAERLVHYEGDYLRYCKPQRRWYVFDGRRWAADDTGIVMRKAIVTVRRIYNEAGATADGESREQLAKHAVASERWQRLEAMIKIAQAHEGIPVLLDDLDADPWLLNVANGTVDLRDGRLRPHRKEDLLTRLIDVEFDPTATAPVWDAFLQKVLGGQDLIAFLQRAVGYALVGVTNERVMFFLHGMGRNGKSTFITAVERVVGDYAVRTPVGTLIGRHEGTIPNDIARLKGARFVAAVESEEGKRLAEAHVKQLTGGDRITARFMRAEWFDFTPEFTLFVATNHLPTIEGNDRAIWDRVRLIPFSTRIADDEVDDELANRLQAELPGILAWALRGCDAWRQQGLGHLSQVDDAVDSYRTDMDVIGQFLEDECDVGPAFEAAGQDLYRVYRLWCDGAGERPKPNKAFGTALRARGFTKGRNSLGRHTWHGLALTSRGPRTSVLS